jgi:hypothetical protein
MVPYSSALQRIIQPDDGNLSAELAAYILKLDFPREDHRRYAKLSAKASGNSLSDHEQAELDDLITANDVLAILQSKARQSLNKRRKPAA